MSENNEVIATSALQYLNNMKAILKDRRSIFKLR